MNNNGQNFLTFLVPVIILVVWAIGQIFNREPQTLQQRTGSPLGPRPGGLPPGYAQARRSETNRPTTAFDARTGDRYGSSGPGRPEEGVVIITSKDEYPTAMVLPSPGREGQNERRPKRRQARPSTPRQADRPPPAKPASLVSGGPIDLGSVASTSTAQETPTGDLRGDAAAFSSAETFRTTARSPERLREMMLMNAVLQTPPGLRALQRRRRRG